MKITIANYLKLIIIHILKVIIPSFLSHAIIGSETKEDQAPELIHNKV
jgi:hypothetical protein